MTWKHFIRIITLHNPKIKEDAIKSVAANMIKDGDSGEKIRRCTDLDKDVIAELRKMIVKKGAH